MKALNRVEKLEKVISNAKHLLLTYGSKASSSAFRILSEDYYKTSLEKEIESLNKNQCI